MMRNLFIITLAAGLLAGCSSVSRTKQAPVPPPLEAKAKGGGYYLDDGPGDNPPPNLHEVPDAVPRDEPLHRYANRPYEVMGVSYTPVGEPAGFRQEGVASWYGKRFHGKKTSSGEVYNMYGMTAAHPTLPIPSYVRVTALDSGKSVVVRINDRGPFHSDRVIDLSYTAAYKLGLLGRGSGKVSVERIDPATAASQRKAVAENAVKTTGSADSGNKPGYYLQLGAFGSQANAEKLLSQVRAALDIPAELVQVALVGSLHRVKLGPFSDQDEAGSWLEKARAALGITAIKITP